MTRPPILPQPGHAALGWRWASLHRMLSPAAASDQSRVWSIRHGFRPVAAKMAKPASNRHGRFGFDQSHNGFAFDRVRPRFAKIRKTSLIGFKFDQSPRCARSGCCGSMLAVAWHWPGTRRSGGHGHRHGDGAGPSRLIRVVWADRLPGHWVRLGVKVDSDKRLPVEDRAPCNPTRSVGPSDSDDGPDSESRSAVTASARPFTPRCL